MSKQDNDETTRDLAVDSVSTGSRCVSPMDCGVSKGIHNGLTFGAGKLEHYGYWEIPCDHCARKHERDNPNDGECWPWASIENVNIHCLDQSGSRICYLSSKNRLKGVTRNGAYYALNDMTAEVVPLSVAERLHAALTTTLECLEMDGSGKAYAEGIARETLDEIHSQNE